MRTFRVRVIREDVYDAYVEVEAETRKDAEDCIQGRLNEHGWDDVVGEDEGEYCECSSTVERLAGKVSEETADEWTGKGTIVTPLNE